MSGKRITQLILRDDVEAGNSFPLDDGIQTYRVTSDQIKDFVLANGNITLPMLADALQELLVPVGTVIATARNTAPTGYLHCDGAAVSRTTYAGLFTAIGTAHGTGDGTTTFNLPDYRGRFLRGWANGQTTDPDRAARTAMATGGATGDNVGSVQTGATARPTTALTTGIESANHTHAWTTTIVGQGGSGAAYGPGGATAVNTGTQSANHTHTVTGGGDAETRPLNAYVMYCIKF